jgi:nicotinamidase/pyrazinamidase
VKPDHKRSALLVVDVQYDFCPEGALAVPEGDAVVAPINAIISRFRHVVLTQDWHPAGHVSFASTWAGREPYETVEADGIPQVLWPDHCVQGSRGAAFHEGLDLDRATVVIRKGTRSRLDSYSAFIENDRVTSTGLDGWLRDLGVTTVYIAGLATDYCVFYSALDAFRFGYEVVVVADAVRGVDVPPGNVARSLERIKKNGVGFVRSGEIE